MNRSVFPIRTVSVAGLVVLLALLHTRPAQGLTLSQITPEPPPRPTATPAPCIEVDPTQAVGQQDVELLVTGYCWPAGLPGVTLFFDVADSVHRLAGPFPADAAGSFQRVVIVPAAWASPGLHAVIACSSGGSCASATIELLAPTPTITPTPTDTLTPTATRTPTDTPTPVTPSPTATTTNTPTPSSTMRPVTPIVTGTTTPRATSQPPSAATSTTAPIPPAVPTATATSRPVIIASSTSTFTPSPTSTPTSTDTPTPTSTDTPTPTSTDTPTPTPTSTSTPTPTSTPRPSLPVAASLATSSVPPSTAANLPDTGRDWVATFLTGFIAAILLIALLTAFMVVVFASLLVAWRILRMRQLEGQR